MDTLEQKVTTKKIATADTIGKITYSWMTGSILDIITGLNLEGIIIARTTATPANFLLAPLYGWWREQAYKITNTNEKSSKTRKYLTELFAFNTFQVPMYGGLVLGITSYATKGQLDYDKMMEGARNLALMSPAIGPIMGVYIDWIRKKMGINKAAKGTYNSEKKTS